MAWHQVDRGQTYQSQILRRTRRIQRAEIRNDHGSVGLLQRDKVSGRIEPEFDEVCALVVARIETSRRLRDVHEMQRQIEMRCELRGDGCVRPLETPSAAFGAAEAYSLLAGPDLGGGDVRGKGGYNTVRLETELGRPGERPDNARAVNSATI